MSKSAILKASAILVGLSFFAATVSPIFAASEQIRTVVGPVTRLSSSASAATRVQLLNQKAEERKENVENKISNIKEKLASRAAVLKTRLQAFKDKKKAETAERVNTNLNAINQKQTAQMEKHLGNMSAILDKLENRINQGSPDIKDPAGAKAAIASARANIATASAAATAQSLKDYTIQVTSETKIRVDAKLQRDKLHTDLLTLRKAVIDAKQSAANAIRIAKSGPVPAGTGLNKEATSSGQ